MISQLTSNALKGQQQLAQGSAFALTARHPLLAPHPGRCPGQPVTVPSQRTPSSFVKKNHDKFCIVPDFLYLCL